ncbi:hypothetical protein F385_1813 [Pantoea agglomerans 299R]|nr:hypothetical protein F385_1813 [Pantoea agglomerans 299R]
MNWWLTKTLAASFSDSLIQRFSEAQPTRLGFFMHVLDRTMLFSY